MPFIVWMTIVGVIGFFILLPFMFVLRVTSCPVCRYGRLFEKPIRDKDPQIVEAWCPSCKSLFESKTSRKKDKTGKIRIEKEIYPVRENVPEPPWVGDLL